MPTESLSPHKMGIYYRCISTYDYSNGDEISDFVYLSFPKCYHITYSFKPPTHDQQKKIYIYQLATSHFGRCPKFQNFMSFTSFKSSHFWVHKTIQLLGSPWLAPLPLQVAARWALAPASPAPDGSRTARPRCDRLERWWYTYPSEKYDLG